MYICFSLEWVKLRLVLVWNPNRLRVFCLSVVSSIDIVSMQEISITTNVTYIIKEISLTTNVATSCSHVRCRIARQFQRSNKENVSHSRLSFSLAHSLLSMRARALSRSTPVIGRGGCAMNQRGWLAFAAYMAILATTMPSELSTFHRQ